MYSTHSISNTYLDGGKDQSSLVSDALLSSVYYINMFLSATLIFSGASFYVQAVSLSIILFNTLTSQDSPYLSIVFYYFGGLPGYHIGNAIYNMLHHYLEGLIKNPDSIETIQDTMNSKFSNIVSNMLTPITIALFNTHKYLYTKHQYIKSIVTSHIDTQNIWRQTMIALKLVYNLSMPCMTYFLIVQNPILDSHSITLIGAHSFFYIYYMCECYQRQYINPLLAQFIHLGSNLLDNIHNLSNFRAYTGNILYGVILYFYALGSITTYAYAQDKPNYAARLVQTVYLIARSTSLGLLNAVLLAIFYTTKQSHQFINYARHLLSHALYQYYITSLVYKVFSAIFHVCINPIWYSAETVLYYFNNTTLLKSNLYDLYSRSHILRTTFITEASFRAYFYFSLPKHTSYYYDTLISLKNSAPLEDFFRYFYTLKNINSTHLQWMGEEVLDKNTPHYSFQTNALFSHLDITAIDQNIEVKIPYIINFNVYLLKNIHLIQPKPTMKCPHPFNISEQYTDLIWEECLSETSLKNGNGLLANIPTVNMDRSNLNLNAMHEHISQYAADNLDQTKLTGLKELFHMIIPLLTSEQTQKITAAYQDFTTHQSVQAANKEVLSKFSSIKNKLSLLDTKLIKTRDYLACLELYKNMQDKDLQAYLLPLVQGIHPDEEFSDSTKQRLRVDIDSVMNALNQRESFADQSLAINLLEKMRTIVEKLIASHNNTPDYQSFIASCTVLQNSALTKAARLFKNYFSLNLAERKQLKSTLDTNIKKLASYPERKLEAFCQKAASVISLANWNIFIQNFLDKNKLGYNNIPSLSGGSAQDMSALKVILGNFWSHQSSYLSSALKPLDETMPHENLYTVLYDDYLKDYSSDEMSHLKTTFDASPHLAIALYYILRQQRIFDPSFKLTRDNIFNIELYILTHPITLNDSNRDILNTMCQNYISLCLRMLNACNAGLTQGLQDEDEKFIFKSTHPTLGNTVELNLRGYLKNAMDDNSTYQNLSDQIGNQSDQTDGVHTRNMIDNMLKFPVGLGSAVAFYESHFTSESTVENLINHSTSMLMLHPHVQTEALTTQVIQQIKNIYTQFDESSFNTPSIREFETKLTQMLSIPNENELTTLFQNDCALAVSSDSMTGHAIRNNFFKNLSDDSIPNHWHGIALCILLNMGFLSPNTPSDYIQFKSSQFILESQSMSLSERFLNITSYCANLLKSVANLVLRPLQDLAIFTQNILHKNSMLHKEGKLLPTLQMHYGLQATTDKASTQDTHTSPSRTFMKIMKFISPDNLEMLPKKIIILLCDLASLVVLPTVGGIMPQAKGTSASSLIVSQAEAYVPRGDTTDERVNQKDPMDIAIGTKK